MIVEYKGDKTALLEPGEQFLGVYEYMGTWKENISLQATVTYKMMNNKPGSLTSKYIYKVEKLGAGWISYPFGSIAKFYCNTTHFEDCPETWEIVTKNGGLDDENLSVKCGK